MTLTAKMRGVRNGCILEVTMHDGSTEEIVCQETYDDDDADGLIVFAHFDRL